MIENCGVEMLRRRTPCDFAPERSITSVCHMPPSQVSLTGCLLRGKV